MSVHDYGSANVNTLQTSAGFLLNLSVNLQFILGYGSIAYLILRFIFFYKKTKRESMVSFVKFGLDFKSYDYSCCHGPNSTLPFTR